MKYKFCRIRINVIKYDVTFATKGNHLFTFEYTTRMHHWYRICRA